MPSVSPATADHGYRFVKQYHHSGDTFELSDGMQSRRRYSTWREAVEAGEAWEQDANKTERRTGLTLP